MESHSCSHRALTLRARCRGAIVVILHEIFNMTVLKGWKESYSFWDDTFAAFFSFLGVFSLGYFGAKHLDTTMLSWYMCAGGCCAFLWGIVTVLFLLEFVGGSDGPLTGAELQECLDAEKIDPVGDPCTEAAKRGEGAHPMDSIPLLLLNALLCLGVFTACKLYKHPATNSEMRNIPI